MKACEVVCRFLTNGIKRYLFTHSSGLKVLNNWPTFPQLIVHGELVGGLDIVREMIESGEFDEVVKGS